MKRAWKPGDVAMAHDERVFMDLSCEWRWVETRRVCLDQPPYGLRPLVVIDPGDREQVERLIKELRSRGLAFCNAQDVAAALREFANPKPPKPEEPTGLGAVVEDAQGRRWVRIEELPPFGPWYCGVLPEDDCDIADGAFREYAELDVVRVLAEGVTP